MLPNPADAFSNPMRYWTDLWTFQMQMGQTIYDAAASVNPFLPQISLEAHFDTAPLAPARSAVPAGPVIEHQPTPPAPAAARKPRRKAAPAAKTAAPAAKPAEPAPRAKAAAKPARKPAAKTAAKSAPEKAKPAPTRRRRATPATPKT